jgi:hypothetical protein
MYHKNPQRRNALIWLFISLAGLLMVFIPFVFDVDMMNGGGVLIFVGMVFSISGILVSVIFFKRSGALKRMFTGEGLLAHWIYDKTTWKKHSENEYAYRKSANRLLKKT